MAKDTDETLEGGYLRDKFGRRELVLAEKHAAPGTTALPQGDGYTDADGREQVVLLGADGRSISSRVDSVESGVGSFTAAGEGYQPSSNGSSLTIWSKPQRINPHASTYGAVGDGVTNDYTAITAALTRANAIGAVVELSGADYLLNGTLDAGLAPIIGRGRGKTRLLVGSAGALVKVQGSQVGSNTATLTSNAARFAEVIALSTVTGIAAGDYLLIGSSGTFQTEHTDHLPGEIVRVKSIASLNVTLHDPLRGEYLTADTAAVKKLTMVSGARIEGMTMHNASAGTNTCTGLSATHARDLGISDVGFSQLDGQGAWLNVCSNVTIDGLFLNDLTDDPDNSRYGYGVLLQRATENVTINGGVAHGCRHVITTDGTVGEWGVARDVNVNGMVSHGAKASAFDTHSHSEAIHFNNCHVHGARDFAFHHRARFSSVKGGSATDCRGGAFLETQAVRTEIRGTTFERLGWIAGRASDGSTAWDAGAVAVQMNGPEQTIRDCDISGVAGQAIVAIAARPNIRRNVIKQACLNSDGSRVGGSVGGAVPLAVIELVGTSSNGFVVENEYHADTVLAGYTGFAVTTTATTGVRGSAATGVIRDNRIYGSGITPAAVASGFTGIRENNVRVDEGGIIQRRGVVNITKADFALSGATSGAHTTTGIPYAEFADAASNTVQFLVYMPYDGTFDRPLQSVQLRWSSPGTSGNVRWTATVAAINTGTDMTSGTATSVSGTAAVSGTANGEVQTTLDWATVAGATPNRLLNVIVQRLGSDGADTLANVARLHAVELFYDKG